MQFFCKTVLPQVAVTECLVIPVFQKGGSSAYLTKLAHSAKTLQKILKNGDIKGKPGETLLLPHCEGIKAQRVLLVGCGNKAACTARDYQTILKNICAVLHKLPVGDATLMFDELVIKGRDAEWQALYTAQKITELHCRFEQMKSVKSGKYPLAKVTYHIAEKRYAKKIQAALKTGMALAGGTALARELGNLPGNICTPTYLAGAAVKLAREHRGKLTTHIINEAQMRKLKMNALLSVSAGSKEPAKLIVMEYRGGGKDKKPVVLVGKGVTFDTGGISIKPAAGMEEMKFDMCGAASVLGTLKTACELKLPLNIVGVIAAAENMPGGTATKPGDVVTTMNGLTVEIVNTDAEGRLVLCDALTYVERFNPDVVIDIATLTGACVIALGNHASGLYSNRDELAHSLLDAGQLAEDKAWHMPLWDEYQSQLKSDCADMSNVGGRNAGSVTAACFLSRFAKKYAWAHLDIAGTAWTSSPKAATGRPVPLLVHYLLERAGL